MNYEINRNHVIDASRELNVILLYWGKGMFERSCLCGLSQNNSYGVNEFFPTTVCITATHNGDDTVCQDIEVNL